MPTGHRSPERLSIGWGSAEPAREATAGMALALALVVAWSATGSAQPIGGAQPIGAAEIHLDLSRRELELVRDGLPVNRWPVVIGAPETPTPVGRFQVQSKVINPIYQSTSTGLVKGVGPLGYRWLGFFSRGPDQFGIHGTPWPWWVDARAAVSHGCVRMRNEHIADLFAAVEIGTPVIIQP